MLRRGGAVPPGPRGLEVFGFFGRGSAARILVFLEQTARHFGPISSFRILNRRICLVDDPDLINEILVTRQHEFVRDSGATLLRELVGDGLLTSDEPRHRERRRMLQPAFHKERISSYAAAMVREAEYLADEWRGTSEVDVGAEMRKLTLAAVGATLFGTDFRESAGRIAAVLRRVGRRLGVLGPAIAFMEVLPLAYRRICPQGPSLFFRQDRAELERIIAPLVRERRAGAGSDLLSLLLNLRDDSDQPLDEEDVRNEVVTLVLAGHETTSAALKWTWFLLATHPRVEQRFHEEIDSIPGSRSVTFDDLPRLRYTSWVFAEAMRLYPPAPVFGRRPTKAAELGGYRLPAGAAVLLSPYVTQRNERFFSEPERFKPERWETPPAAKFAYFPFGGGAKMCLGEAFARTEAVLALAALGRRWRLRCGPEWPLGTAPSWLERPGGPILMKPESRPLRGAPLTAEPEERRDCRR